MDKKRVLIVDDEKDFLTIVKLNLEDTGQYEVKTISNANEIISEVQTFKPDVILMDIIMPSLDGIEACKMIHSDPAGKTIPVIMVSALDRQQEVARAYKEGAADFLVKPVGKDVLLAALEKILV